MSTITLIYPNVIRLRRASAIRLTMVMMILALITGATLVIVLSTNSSPSDRIPVPQNSITPISVPVPTPPIAVLQPVPSETPAPFSGVRSEPSVVAVPVPTP
jgi:hypothetical protein